MIDVILGDPGAVIGAGEKSKRVRKKFGRRPVQTFSPPPITGEKSKRVKTEKQSPFYNSCAILRMSNKKENIDSVIRKLSVNTLKFLDHGLSICDVCNRCLFSFPSELELAEEQEYL